ncbi:hypothetical protein DV515_00003052 [Chloebia gouldiae]|uniref:Uncharacterized protein n=1 Tax=Chloebia gouldiae TaxID=44316 RepID=A0A3L8SU26_CHLGU|nr:hypothetical protein DV515_00003052 [Chloebia gouldiae]
MEERSRNLYQWPNVGRIEEELRMDIQQLGNRFLRKRAWTACKVVKYLQTARMILLVVAYGESDSLE